MAINQLYLSKYQKIHHFNHELKELFENLPSCSDERTFEENQIYEALYKLHDALCDTACTLDYYTSEAKEGFLKISPYNEGRFALGKHEFTCGCLMEVFIWGKWHEGRAEYSDEYYFVGVGNPTFAELMKKRIKVRIRL